MMPKNVTMDEIWQQCTQRAELGVNVSLAVAKEHLGSRSTRTGCILPARHLQPQIPQLPSMPKVIIKIWTITIALMGSLSST